MSRKRRLTAKGRQLYTNAAEDDFAVLLRDRGIGFSRRGYPDFTIYDSKGSICGFAEIKPNDDRKLKPEQELFAEFCQKFGVPFLKWTPKDGEEFLNTFLQETIDAQKSV